MSENSLFQDTENATPVGGTTQTSIFTNSDGTTGGQPETSGAPAIPYVSMFGNGQNGFKLNTFGSGVLVPKSNAFIDSFEKMRADKEAADNAGAGVTGAGETNSLGSAAHGVYGPTSLTAQGIKDAGNEAWNFAKNNRGGLVFNALGLGDNVTGFTDRRDRATTPAADAPPSEIKVINDDSEVEWRDKTPGEVTRDAAHLGLTTQLLGTATTKNIGVGSGIGWGAEFLGKGLYQGTQVPKNFYIRQQDLNGLESTFKENDQRVEAIQEANNKPYWD